MLGSSDNTNGYDIFKFQQDGTLEPGLYIASPATFCKYFCDIYNRKTSSRRKILNGFFNYLFTLAKYNALHSVFIDGSYATQKESPGDIDISVVINADNVNSINDAPTQSAITQLFDDRFQIRNKKRFYTHPYQAIPYSPYYVQSGLTRMSIRSALKFWTQKKNDNKLKGIIYMPCVNDYNIIADIALKEMEVLLS